MSFDARRDPEFESLVRRSQGFQPWRRIFHAANGIFIVLALKALPIRTWDAVVLLGVVFSVLLLLDGVRLTNPQLNRLFFQLFSPLVSPREAKKPASSTWYVLGILLTLLLFPRQQALGGILVLALADPAAAFAGRHWGKRRLGAGTVEGSLAFVGVAFLVLLPFTPWPVALAGALAGALVEVLPWDVDDNLVVPPVVAGVLFWLSGQA